MKCVGSVQRDNLVGVEMHLQSLCRFPPDSTGFFSFLLARA